MLSPRPLRWEKTIEYNIKVVQFNIDEEQFEREGLTICPDSNFVLFYLNKINLYKLLA